MKIIYALIIIVMFLAIIYYGILLIKNAVTYRCRIKIMNAIHRYNMACLDRWYGSNERLITINYSDMEPYDKTLYRFFDWGYEHILPKEKYEIIRPYICNND